MSLPPNGVLDEVFIHYSIIFSHELIRAGAKAVTAIAAVISLNTPGCNNKKTEDRRVKN